MEGCSTPRAGEGSPGPVARSQLDTGAPVAGVANDCAPGVGPHDVGASEQLSKDGSRLHVTVGGRFVTLVRWKGELHAIDSICFHAGGPLGVGDIEDVNGKPCLLCPWHYYQVDIATGDKYYQKINFEEGKMKKGEWCSNGIKQRVHYVAEHGGRVMLTLRLDGTIESDKYAHNAQCGERMNGRDSSSTRSQQSVGGDGKLPGGRVFASRRGGGIGPYGLGPAR